MKERKVDMIEIPHALKEAIREGRAVLFLGAGASMGAKSNNGSNPPNGLQLTKMLSDRFLGGQDSENPLCVVAEYSISETDLVSVQEFIRDIFSKFEPADFHLLIPTFKWAAIATTNYDLIIERAYSFKLESKSSEVAQELVPFLKNTDRIDRKLRSDKAVPYLKLHGCISKIDDLDIPLILTIDQYVTHKKNRNKLFERLRDYGEEYPIVFIGYRLEDPDIRQILLALTEDGISRPRYYVVSPKPSDRQIRFWESKKITALDGTLKEFIITLDSQLDSALRSIRLPEREHEIGRKFVTRDQQLSAETLALLNTDAIYITSSLPSENTSAEQFYKGYTYGWDAIQKVFDARRDIVDTILADVILADDIDRSSATDMYVIKGHAGAGKTVILKRLAWDSATEFGKLCLYFDSLNPIDANAIFEILGNIDERVYLFIDQASDHVNDLKHLISTARKRKERLTIIIAERTNEWNIDCNELNQFVDEVYDVKYLNHNEILTLISKLTEHKSLGLLEGLADEKKINAFEKKAGRQLLVALHEATLGKPFEEIICNEFQNIEPETARRIYQTVCVLNRLNVPVRAGIIKRVHGVTFSEFKEKFFGPLEAVVYARFYEAARDMSYTARHPWIAEIVFEKTLPNSEERLDLYLRIMEAIDIGYNADRTAYRSLIKAKELLRLFHDPKIVRAIYDRAKGINDNDPYYHQQRAIYEMRRDNPNYETAYEELKRAELLAPYDKSVKHSLAELELLRAKNANSEIESERHINAAIHIAQTLTGTSAETSYGYHTLIKIAIDRLDKQLKVQPENDQIISSLVKEAEGKIKDAFQKFPDDEYLLSAESQLAKLINEDTRAVTALEHAFKVNPMSPFLARGLARLYQIRKNFDKAKEVLEKCLEGLPGERSVNSALASLYTHHFLDEKDQAEYYWRRSFTEGDCNYANQFWYARQLYINGKQNEAMERFNKLRGLPISPDIKQKIRAPILDKDGNQMKFRGRIEKLEASYALLSQEVGSNWAFLHRSNVPSKKWDVLQRGVEVTYHIGFTYRGLGAFDLELI